LRRASEASDAHRSIRDSGQGGLYCADTFVELGQRLLELRFARIMRCQLELPDRLGAREFQTIQLPHLLRVPYRLGTPLRTTQRQFLHALLYPRISVYQSLTCIAHRHIPSGIPAEARHQPGRRK
jgi:hypothetical protein